MRKQRLKHKSGEFIPCLYMPHLNGSSKIMIYFHGNAEDIGLATDLLSYIMDKMSVSFFRFHFSDSYSRHGVPWLRSLPGGSDPKADCAWCIKRIWLPDDCARNSWVSDHSLRPFYRVWPGNSDCLTEKTMCNAFNVALQVHQRHREGLSRFPDAICHLGSFQERWEDENSRMSIFLYSRLKRLTHSLLALTRDGQTMRRTSWSDFA